MHGMYEHTYDSNEFSKYYLTDAEACGGEPEQAD